LNGDSHTPVAVSPDGKEIFSGERMIFRHNFATGKRIFPPQDDAVLKGEIRSVSVSGSGKLYVATGYQMEIWNVANQRESVRKFDDDVRVIRLSGDGSLVAVGTDKNSVHVVQTKDGKEIAKLDVKRQVRQLEFVGNDRILVNTGTSQASLMKIKTGETIYSFTQSSLDRIAVSPDALRLITASDGKPLQVWDAQSGKSMGSFSLPEGAETVAGTAFLSDSKSILVVGKLKLSAALYREKKVEHPISEAEFLKLVEALGESNFWARELASKKLVELGESILPLLESAKGTNKEGEYRLRLVASSLREALKPSALETILENDANFANLLVHPTKPVWAATSGDNPVRGQVLFGGFHEGKPVVLQKLTGGRGPNALSFDKDGNRLAVGNDDGTVSVYQVVKQD
jgi:WD40 repeat protein